MARPVEALENRKWLQVSVLIASCLALYGQTIGFDYVWDDTLIFLDKSSLTNEPLSWGLLTEPFLEWASYMRPLVIFTWWAEFRVFGQHPAISHGINTLLFMTNVLLLRALATRVFYLRGKENPSAWATLSALLYAVHPVLVESTAWVSGRFDVLCTTGILAASLALLSKNIPNVCRTLLVAMFAMTALLSKELGVMVPLILACVWMATHADPEISFRSNVKRAIRSESTIWIGLLVVLIAYFSIRRGSMGEVYHYTNMWGGDYAMAVLKSALPLEALKLYTKMAFWPFGNVGIFHPQSQLELDARAWFGSAAALTLAILVLWKAVIRGRGWAWLGLAAYSGIALVLHIIPMTISDNIGNERFMTASMAFVCMAVPLLPWRELSNLLSLRVPVRRICAILLIGGWLGLSAHTSLQVIPLWTNSVSLWHWTHMKHPAVDPVRYNYMEAALGAERYDLLDAVFQPRLEDPRGLSVDEQIIYSNYLLRKGDPEALKYMQGLMYALPKLHELPENVGRAAMRELPLSSMQVFSVYSNMALATLLFELDAEQAKRYSEISRWYLGSGLEIYADYTDAAISYSSGDLPRGDQLMKKSEGVYHVNRHALKRQVRVIVRKYCERMQEEQGRGAYPQHCESLEGKGFFETESE